MTFEKTRAIEHSEAEVQEEENDLKETEETVSEDGHSEEETTEPEEDTSTNESAEEDEESVDTLKERLAKAERDRDNYKQGMLSEKAKKRVISDSSETEGADVNEQVVLEVLGKQSEKTALRNTIDPKHSDYIPELVDDTNYQEIISYLPRSIDKSDYNSIVKSLKIATKIWKDEKGISDKPVKKVSIPSPKTTQAKQTTDVKKKEGRNIVGKGSVGMDKWYS
jgi:hypothetical protein